MSEVIDNARRIVIEAVTPQLDCGRYPVKRELGDEVRIEADIFKEGHDAVAAAIWHKAEGEDQWRRAPMHFVDNDRWAGSFRLDHIGRHYYSIAAWTDAFATWAADLRAKYNVGYDVSGELLEGSEIVREVLENADGQDRARIEELLHEMSSDFGEADRVAAALSPELLALAETYSRWHGITLYDRVLEVRVDRVRARYGAWYEMFPRSAADDPDRHGTFEDVIRKLPYVRDLGFDVLYFPPIHPIGFSHRKGRNNSLECEPDAPGSPYAIGNERGGHKSVHPELGTLEDFRRLVAAAAEHGLEIALDFAIQVSPDHPYVREHPDWFFVRPDGTIKYAENPPKKYEDIYPLNFYGPSWRDQWHEWMSVLLFWIGQGIRIFRVDNPHTKPLQFWEWAIREIQRDHPDVIFLSEAFTRPKMMRALAKVGFTQSYTYFTWRNFKGELQDYFTELTQGPMREYFRGNLFTNTPDINPEFLQKGGRPAFMIRAVLAATLSSIYGIYSGFELCEAAALPGREEYLDSEKYQLKAWDWDREGNIRDFITRLNQIRRGSPALQEYENLRFHLCDSDQVLFYEKAAPHQDDLIFVAVSLDPFEAHDCTLFFPMDVIGADEHGNWEADELLIGGVHLWQGSHQRISLDPSAPARIWRVRRWKRSEKDFDYFMEATVPEAS